MSSEEQYAADYDAALKCIENEIKEVEEIGGPYPGLKILLSYDQAVALYEKLHHNT